MRTARQFFAPVLVLALLLPLLAACASGPTPTQAVAVQTPTTASATAAPTTAAATAAMTPTLEATALPTAAPTAATSAAFEKAACPFEMPAGQVEGETVDCGYLSVPEDRADPNSATLKLAVAVFHPGGNPEPDPIIYLEGGPGGSALEFIGLSYPDSVEPYLAANRDVILFDQRGVGLSKPALDCPKMDELELDMLDWEVDGQRLTPQQAADLIVQGDVACAGELSKTADLADYNTEASAADVNDLRQALGYDKVNLWGVSYGTNLALEVMRSYPQGLRSVVIDSVYPPDIDGYVEAPANADRAFDELFDTCAADAVCNGAYPDLRQVMTDTVAQLNETPASFEVSDALTGETYPMVLTGNDLMGMVFQLLYIEDVIPYLPQMIYDARDGKFDLLRRMEGVLIAQQKSLSEGVFYSVSCRNEVSFSSQAEYEKAIARYPAFKGMFEVTNLGPVGYRTCAEWGAGQAPASANEAVTSDIPTLLMAGQYDPITPPSWTERAGQTLENSHFFEYPGLGHGASLAEGCPQDMMLAFIEDPTAALDDSCIADMPSVKWVVAGQAEPVTMEPFTNPLMGTQGVAPAGWEQVNPGVYARGSSALDSAVLLEQAAPMSGQELLNLLVTQLSLKETPKPVAERDANGLTWQLYNVEVQGLAVDIAIAESGSSALVVLLQSDPSEHDALYESVFIPAVDALQLSK